KDLEEQGYEKGIEYLKYYKINDNTKIYTDNNDYLIDDITGRKIYLWYNFYNSESCTYSLLMATMQNRDDK
ncbi:MAG: hypothetical protein LBT29_06640, partial [Flavobacteriaceae bacterium]|nr:hypothetical protein [Flavobacteriaceae bacterium]